MEDEGNDHGTESTNASGAGPLVPPRSASDADTPATTDGSLAEIDSEVSETASDIVEAEYRELLDNPEVRVLLARVLSRSEMTTGSVPPPSFLRQYEEIHPGAAKIVFGRYELEAQMAATEQAHRHALDNKMSDHDISQDQQALSEGIDQARRGQFIGISLAVLFLAATVFVMWYGMKHDHAWVAGTGGVAIIAEVGGLVYIFARERGHGTKATPQGQRTESDGSQELMGTAASPPTLPPSPTR